MIIPSLRHRSVPTISSQKFQANIINRRHEDIQAIETIERYLIEKRGYIFRLPKPEDPVILLLSGGIDSTVAWYVLSSVYNLHVYPLFVAPQNGSAQKHSVAYFSRLYQKLLGNHFHAPLPIFRDFLPKELTDVGDTRELSGETLLEMYNVGEHRLGTPVFSGLSGMAAQYGAIYSMYLKAKHRIAIHTIFCAVTAWDGIGISSQTLTSLRATLFYLMRFHDIPNLQYSSIFFEKETGWYAVKRDIIALGAAVGLPLWKTHSCHKLSTRHCGECLGCRSRQYEFKKASVKDLTIYQTRQKANVAKYVSLATIKRNAKNAVKAILLARR